jgi:hypothetical protein
MNFSRPSRAVAALIALVSMLLMQLAVASYACPSTKMEHCQGMDMGQPSLCHAHDQTGNQSLDKSPAPDVPTFIPAALVVILTSTETALPLSTDRADIFFLTRATAPPLAIRHCCFRI